MENDFTTLNEPDSPSNVGNIELLKRASDNFNKKIRPNPPVETPRDYAKLFIEHRENYKPVKFGEFVF